MSFIEKAYSIFSIIFAFCLLTAFALYPELRQLNKLIPLSLVGLLVNIGFMFVVLRHILVKAPFKQKDKIFWIALVLVFWPSAIVYLAIHGFRKTDNQ